MNSFEQHKKSTDELMTLIINSRNDLYQLIEDVRSEYLDMELTDFFNHIMSEKKLTPTQIVKKSNLQNAYAYQILSGERKHPSRNKLLALAFATDLTLDETQQMLKIAHLPVLYPRHRQDLVVIFALKEHYGLFDVNEILMDLGEPLLQ